MAIKNDEKTSKRKSWKIRNTNNQLNVLLHKPKLHDARSQLGKFYEVLVDTFYEYVENTKVNGTYYIRRFVTRGWLRLALKSL